MRGESGQDGGGGKGRFGCGGCRRGEGALAESRGYDRCTVSFRAVREFLQGARQAPRTGRNVQVADSNIGGASADAGGVARGIGSIPRRKLLGY